MIYITHLHQARLIMKKLNPNYDIPSFSFKSYPTVKGIFTGIKIHLKKLSSGPKSEADSKKKVSSLVKDLQKTVTACKNSLYGIMEWLLGIQEKLESVEKKVKILEKRRAGNVPLLKHWVINLENKKILRKKEKKKQKKKEQKNKPTEESEK